jgi:hypothetical protein
VRAETLIDLAPRLSAKDRTSALVAKGVAGAGVASVGGGAAPIGVGGAPGVATMIVGGKF